MDSRTYFRYQPIATRPVSIALRKIVLCFFLCACIWLTGLLWFVAQIPEHPSTDQTHTDAIVALTGGSNRLEYGLKLLSEGKGSKLFISGVHDKTTLETMLHHAPAEVREKMATLPANSVILGHEAENTIGNAEETSRWLTKEKIHSIRLVTSYYHMPRSLEEFKTAMPTLLIVPEPVFPDNFNLSGWWMHGESRMLVLLEFHKYMASKLRHWFLSVRHHHA